MNWYHIGTGPSEALKYTATIFIKYRCTTHGLGTRRVINLKTIDNRKEELQLQVAVNLCVARMASPRAGDDMDTETSMQADTKQDLETAAGSEDTSGLPTQTKASPVPKVIKGMLVKANTHMRPINSPSTDSPSTNRSLAGNGNPPSGIVKGRKATLESNGIGVARQSDGACPSGQVKSAPGTGPHASPKGTTTSVPLTEGWEEDVDPRSGKKFYVNHKIKKWSWNLPIHVAAAAAAAAAQAKETAATPTESAQASIASDEETVRLQGQRPTKSSGPLPSITPAHMVVGQGSRELPTTAVASDARSIASTSSSVPEIPEHQTMPADKAVSDSTAILTPQPKVQKVFEHEASKGRRKDTDTNPENAPRQDTDSGRVVPVVPPLKISRRDVLLRHEDDVSEAPVTLDSKWSRMEHDREVEELKSEIHLIRSQSKQQPRKPESWDAHAESISHRECESRLHGHVPSARSASKLNSQGSPLTKVDIYQIRKVFLLPQSFCIRKCTLSVCKLDDYFSCSLRCASGHFNLTSLFLRLRIRQRKVA